MRNIRTHIKQITLKTIFPPRDPAATAMARLCILREDLYLELRGMVTEPLPALDECSMEWRTIYFFRNSVRTLLEIRSAVETLRKQKRFLIALSKQPEALKSCVGNLAKTLTESHNIVKKLRNEVGGHLPHQALEEGLAQIDSSIKGWVQLGNSARQMHYKFGLEFLGATMLRHVPIQDAEEEWGKIMEATIALCFDAIKAIDLLFVSYTRIYGHALIDRI